VTLAVFPLTKFTVVDSGAGEDRVTGNGADCPSPSVTFVGIWMVPSITELTVATAGAITGIFDWAVIVAVPGLNAVTRTVPMVLPCGTITLVGTVATEVLLDVRLKVRPPVGAGAERRRLMLLAPPAPTVTA